MKHFILKNRFIFTLLLIIISITIINTKEHSNSLNIQDVSTNKNILYKETFEDGDFGKFEKRGSTTTISISDISYSGSKSLLVSNRKEDWSGVQIDIDSFASPNTEYIINAKVKSSASTIKFQYKYKDLNGNMVYKSLGNYSGDDWNSIENVKFTFDNTMSEVYLYFAGGTEDIYIDDFEIEIATIENLTPLKKAYQEHFEYLGVGIGNKSFASPQIQKLTLRHFNTVAITNELKPDYILDKEASIATGSYDNPQIDISSAKDILSFCEKNNLNLHLHTLTWYDQTPDWFFRTNYDSSLSFADKETMKRRLENYIKNIFNSIKKTYPNLKIVGVDVANEAWLESGTYRSYCPNTAEDKVKGLHCSGWTTIFGDNSYIEYAFFYARKYAPSTAKLYYADFSNYVPKKRDAIYNMALELKKKNLIDGLALHSHLTYNFSTEKEYKEHLSLYEETMKKYISTGLKIAASEIDVGVPNKDLNLQAKFSSDYMDLLVKYSDNISYVAFWSITDDFSWKSEQVAGLFTANYKAKPCFYKIIDNIPKKVTTYTKNDDNTLKQITIDNTPISNFNPNITSYSITTDKSSITIKATLNNSKSTVEGNKTISLNYGDNTHTITVTSEKGTKKTYTLIIKRLNTKSNISTLNSLSLSTGEIQFNKDITTYDIQVPTTTDKLTIVSSLTDPKSTYLEQYGNREVTLDYGLNTILIKVKSEQGNINTYTLNITRIAKSSLQVSDINIKDYNLNFNQDTYSYNLPIKEETTSLDISVNLIDQLSTYEIIGNENLTNNSKITIIIKDNTNSELRYTINIVKDNKSPAINENKLDKTEKLENKKNNILIPIIIGITLITTTIIIIIIFIKQKN